MTDIVFFDLGYPALSFCANLQGINVADITKLKAAGIVTVLGVAQTPRKNLMKIKVSFPGNKQIYIDGRESPR